MAKTKPKLEEVQDVKTQGKDARILRILNSLQGSPAPSIEELNAWAEGEPPEPTLGDLAFQAKKKKPWL
jgi:hypothetical protein